MPDAIGTVAAFLDAFAEDGGRPAIRRWFTPATVWINEGLATTTGIDEAVALIDGLERTMGIATIRIETLAIAQSRAGAVLTERIDRMYRADGGEIAAPRVMGIFELDGERIVAWRDYFDSALATRLAAG